MRKQEVDSKEIQCGFYLVQEKNLYFAFEGLQKAFEKTSMDNVQWYLRKPGLKQ